MFLLSMLLLLAPHAPDKPAPFQSMTSPAFEAFARLADTRCPARKLRFLTPGDLGGKQELFENRLSGPDRARLARADRGFKSCANQDGGLSCPTQHRLEAMRRLGLLAAFTRSACSTAG